MLKNLIFIAALICSINAIAQDVIIVEQEVEESKKISHYIGLQANPLFRQLLSLSDTPDSDNPFLLTYALRLNPSDISVYAGVGHSNRTSENLDGLKISTTEFSARIGAGKRQNLGRKFEFGYGFDFFIGESSTETFTVQVIDFNVGSDSTYSTTKSVMRSYGFGPQLNISFNITDNIQIGTEASYYYIRATEKFHSESQNFLTFEEETEISSNVENEQNDISEFRLNIPIAIFLIIKI